MARPDILLHYVEQHPSWAFIVFAALHLVVWMALPTILYDNLPLDLIEALTYGREWQLGYDKLPPLPWWFVEIVHGLFGHDFAYYAFAQITVVGAFAVVWATALPLVGPAGALVSLLVIDGLHYFNFTAVKFNHDVIQLPFWALAGFAFHAALRTGRLVHWAVLGAALGLAFWAKYFVVVLGLPLVLFLLIDGNARKALATPGPYIAVLVALVVALPHLAWLVANDFLPFAYASGRAAAAQGVTDHLTRPLAFLAGQLFWMTPALVIAVPLVHGRQTGETGAVDCFDRRILTLLAFGPAATLIAGSAISGRGLIGTWGYPLWLFLGVWIVVAANTAVEHRRFRRVTAVWSIVTLVYAIAFIADYAVLPRFDHRYRAVLFPGDRLAQEIATRFRAHTGKPLAYVIGSMWLGGNVSRYDPDRPRTLIDGEPRRAPWIDLSDLRARGAAVVWTDGDRTQIPTAYRAIAENAAVQPPLTLPMRRGGGEVSIGWAILPPEQ